MPITLKQLAKELGLDYSTVSYALSGKGSINEATRQRVRESAERLGYVPNALARRMRTGKTHCLGLVMPDSLLVYNEVIQLLYRNAQARGYELQIALTEFVAEAEEVAIQSMLEQQVDGLLVHCTHQRWATVPENGALRRAAAMKLPTVIYGHTVEGSPFHAVRFPESRKAALATRHLLELGHRRFANLVPTYLPLFYAAHRSAIQGAYETVQEWGLGPEAFQVLLVESDETPEPDQVSYGNYLNEILPRSATARGRIELRKLLESPNPPTGIICYNEVVAMGALLEALEQGLRVPEDLAFVCTNRSIIAELAPLSLTTADYPSVASAECAMDLLMDTLHGRVTEITYRTVDPVLKVGQTSVAQRKPQPPGVAVSYSAKELLEMDGED